MHACIHTYIMRACVRVCVCVCVEHLSRCKTSTWWCRFLLIHLLNFACIFGTIWASPCSRSWFSELHHKGCILLRGDLPTIENLVWLHVLGLSSQGEHSNEPVLFLCVCVRVNYYYDWCWCRPFASEASDRTSQPEKKLDAAAKECRPMLLKQQVSGGAFWHMLWSEAFSKNVSGGLRCPRFIQCALKSAITLVTQFLVARVALVFFFCHGWLERKMVAPLNKRPGPRTCTEGDTAGTLMHTPAWCSLDVHPERPCCCDVMCLQVQFRSAWLLEGAWLGFMSSFLKFLFSIVFIF